jgi:thiol-disulfide isomerase/thioredoxin
MIAIWPGDAAPAATRAGACATPIGERLAAPPADLFRGQVERLRDGRPVKLRAVPDADVYALYFGASWCAPCQAFGRAIKPVYETGEPTELGYEVIFVSMDTPPEDLAYVKAADMPWPYLNAVGRRSLRGLVSPGSPVLPDLVVIDRAGRVLCRTASSSSRALGIRQTFALMREARRAAKRREPR